MQPSTAVDTSAQRTSWPTFQDLSFIKGLDGPRTWPVPAPEPTQPAIPPAKLKRLARHLHSLGERGLFECLKAIISGAPIGDTLEAYTRLDPAVLKYFGGDYLRDTDGTLQ
jgi:hypothetical protein